MYKFEQKIGNNIYVYEIKSFWDKEKKQSRQVRKYIGKRDKVIYKNLENILSEEEKL